MLRADHSPVDWRAFPHSQLALRLRAGVIECEYDLQVRVGYMQAYAAIHGHPRADITAAFQEFGLLYGDARASIPYMTGGKGGTEQLQDERMAFVKAFEDMRLRERKDYRPREASFKPVSLGKSKKK